MTPVEGRSRAAYVAIAFAVLVAPALAGLWLVFLAARGPGPVVLAFGAVALAALLGSWLVAVRRSRWLVALALAPNAVLGLLVWSFGASPLPPPPALDAPLQAASPPPSMAAYRVPTGVTHRTAAFGYRGGSFFERRDFAMTAVLVVHPRGNLLIDTGLGQGFEAQFESLPLFLRATTGYERTRSAAEQLTAAGYDLAALRIVLTHAHWDHVSGMPDFPQTPVLVTAEERAYVAEGGVITGLARSFPGIHYEEYAFEGGPYLGFTKSHDVYGDGSVVVVPSPGHTPGSVIVFLALPGGARYALIGDLVWQLEGITEREERPWVPRVLGDLDPDLVHENIRRVAAIHERYPEIVLMPAHDARGFAALPELGAMH